MGKLPIHRARGAHVCAAQEEACHAGAAGAEAGRATRTIYKRWGLQALRQRAATVARNLQGLAATIHPSGGPP
ncbi:protein of unknown function (plasmid) [Cupriavidus neocaledonicus]|uniref:Uncharacterized protein n=1 Tax=Cupriavidus neocaledonicus TaxID=1040979 RepID=A0A375HV87_9BURK|nr:hypothetical protein CBM2605_B50053 [Cupriavidus neocaledonicus]SPD60784.1 protein of unknown function [Cupriavidus neocaledonicus]